MDTKQFAHAWLLCFWAQWAVTIEHQSLALAFTSVPASQGDTP